jgi:outer membrane protein TolC
MPSTHDVRAPLDADLDRRMGKHVSLSAFDGAVDSILAGGLDEQRAVQIALANSPRMRAALAELGIARGELGAALGLGPLEIDGTIRFGKKDSTTGTRPYEFELELIQNLQGLVTAPRLRAAGRADLAVARATVTATALRLAGKVEIAFQDLIAAQQEVELRRTAFDAADAAAMIRERMHDAGNTTALAQARDRDAREQARVDLGRAEAEVESAREELNALLGLSGAQTNWRAAGTLAVLPDAAPSLDDLETAAVQANVELAGGNARVASAANRLGAERVNTWLPDFGVGAAIVNHGAGVEVGPAVRIGIPLFDWRRGQRARASAELTKAEEELTAIAVELRAAARATRIRALAAYAEAKHIRDVVLPLRQQIVDQTLLHYNAMDANPFELIVARRELADAGHQYLDALRRYWNATSEVRALRRGVQLDSM